MVRPAAGDFQVQIGARARGKRLKEIFEQLNRQVADANIPPGRLGERGRIEHQIRAPAQVDRRQRQAFVHGHDKVAGAVDSLLIAERLPHGLPEHDADIFDRVMLVDVQVAARFEFEVERAVPREELQHVVEKAHAGGDGVASAAIQAEPGADVRLGRRTAERRSTRLHARCVIPPYSLPPAVDLFASLLHLLPTTYYYGSKQNNPSANRSSGLARRARRRASRSSAGSARTLRS